MIDRKKKKTNIRSREANATIEIFKLISDNAMAKNIKRQNDKKEYSERNKET